MWKKRFSMDPNIQGSFLFNNSLTPFPSDLKAPVCPYAVQNSFYKLGPGLSSQLPAGTPHGISDILSRSMMAVSSPGGATTTTLLSGYSTMGGFAHPAAVAGSGMYYNRDCGPAASVGGFTKPAGADCPMKGRSCWAEGGYDWRGGRQPCSNSESGGPYGGRGSGGQRVEIDR